LPRIWASADASDKQDRNYPVGAAGAAPRPFANWIEPLRRLVSRDPAKAITVFARLLKRKCAFACRTGM